MAARSKNQLAISAGLRKSWARRKGVSPNFYEAFGNLIDATIEFRDTFQNKAVTEGERLCLGKIIDLLRYDTARKTLDAEQET